MKKIISFIFILVYVLFINLNNVLASEFGNELDNNKINKMKTKDVNLENVDKNNMSSASIEDIFGDEQAFPFIAGLGKNAAH